MKDTRQRQIGCRQSRDSLPRRPVLLAATPKRPPPKCSDVEAERGQTRVVGWHGVVLEVTTHHLAQPPPLHWDRVMHSPLEFPFQSTQLDTHPITARLAVKQEEAPTGATTDVREP